MDEGGGIFDNSGFACLLQQPKDAKSLAECLDVRLSQMQDWLNRAVMEGKVIKINKPVAYVVNQPATQLSLLE